MKILFIGPYRQQDGWGTGARDYIRSLLKTEHEISCKPIYLSNLIKKDIPIEIQRTEKHTFDSLPDVVIQNVLPSVLNYHHDILNLGLYDIETRHLEHINWARRSNLIDGVCVSSNEEIQILEESGVKIPMFNVGTPINIEEYTEHIDTEPFNHPLINNNFTFYFIGEMIDRKNIEALLFAFFREFKLNEPVSLLLKLNLGEVDEYTLLNLFNEKLSRLKQEIRLYASDKYHNVSVITNHLSFEDLCKLHKACDCFVMPSRGESLCRPIMEAMLMENPAIMTKDAGMNSLNGIYVQSREEPCHTVSPPIPYLYTGNETWREIDIIDLQRKMRKVFKESNFYSSTNEIKKRQKHIIDNFSYEATAQKLNKCIQSLI